MRRMRFTVAVLAVLILSGCGFVEEVRFRPADAPIVAGADCRAADVVAALTNPWTTRTADTGYPPDGFDPVAVIVCERGADATGGATVDTVRLEGDMEPVLAAFREESKRLPDGSVAGCAIIEFPAAALWFVDADGRTIRPAWPSRVCGFQQPPVLALAGLREVDRIPHPVVSPERPCDLRPAHFQPTVDTAELRWQGAEVPVAYELRVPTSDVDALIFCEYPGDRENPIGRSRLGREESRDLMVQVSSAPAADPCAETAARTAAATLSRPNGSGGGHVGVELDGCQRVVVENDGYRSAPQALIAALGG